MARPAGGWPRVTCPAAVSVFARMVPEQKLQLIRALKANSEIVGMTGDGVNDAPALRAADIGIAMGARGTDVARESAALVITDDDFTSIAGGIRQGRGIFANLRKEMSYIIAVHLPIFGMSLIPVFVPAWPLVLLPVQIAFLELIIDPACSIVFESEQIDPAIMDEPPRGRGEPMFSRRVLTIAVLQGLSMLAAVLAAYLWAVLSDRPGDVRRCHTFPSRPDDRRVPQLARAGPQPLRSRCCSWPRRGSAAGSGARRWWRSRR